MPKMRLGWYAGASTALAGTVIFSAFQQRANFYSAMVYLSQSNFCLLVLINFTLLIYGTFVYGLTRLCWGSLRAAEVEQLTERAWFAITETCLAMTIFRDQVGAWFLVMFTALVTGKVWGWIGDGRVEFLEQQPPANPHLFHTRLTISLLMSFIYDILILRYCINTVIREARPDMMVMFLFEFAVLSTTSWRCGARYILSIIEQKMIQTQTQARLLERRQEVREQRNAIMRQRREAVAAGRAMENEEPLPNPNNIDEMDIEVPGWATKGEWMLWLELLTDTVKLIIYVTFFVLLTIFYNFPIHIMRDLLMTARDFLKRLSSVLRYRRAIQEMNKYPDATQEELDQENTCIICREDMRVWDLNANPTALDRIRPKKLPCGHILHLGCLKSWLERQQVCPTCRSPVTADQASQTRHQNVNRAPAAPQRPNNELQAVQGLAHEPRLGRLGVEHPLFDPAAQAALNVDAFGRPQNPVHPAGGRRNVANVRSTEDFRELIREEEQRRQDVEERLRRRLRNLVPPDSQGQRERIQSQSQMQPSQQFSRSEQLVSSAQSGHSVQLNASGSTTGQQILQPLSRTPHQTDTRLPRVFPPGPPQIIWQHQLQQQSSVRSQRLRTLSTLYSQASVLVRQETESLRVSAEQLHVLGQLIGELERLELLASDNFEGSLPVTFTDTLSIEQAIGQHPSLPAHTARRIIPSRSDSPSLARHVNASHSAAIPSGSPDLPEGVAIPSGWTLIPLQRFDNVPQAVQISMQRSSRAPSAGPTTSTLGDDRSQQATTPQQAQISPSAIQMTAQGPSFDGAPGVPDSLPGALRGTEARFGATNFTRSGEGSSGARSEASTSRAAAAFDTDDTPVEEEQSTSTDYSSGTAMPNFGGASQALDSGGGAEATRGERGEIVRTVDAMEKGAAASYPASPYRTGDYKNGEGSSSISSRAAPPTDMEDAEHGKATGKAVTMEEVSDEGCV